MSYRAPDGYRAADTGKPGFPDPPKRPVFPDVHKPDFPELYRPDMLKPEDLERPQKPAKTAAHDYVR